MKLKSKKLQTLVLSFIEGRAKKTISLKPHEILYIEDSVYFLSKKAFKSDWIEIIQDETVEQIPIQISEKILSKEDKMAIAKREAEEYIKQHKH